MASNADFRLVRAAVSTLEWLQSHRTPRGGAVLKHEVERLLEQCLVDLDQTGHVDEQIRNNLCRAMAVLADYIERIR
jgi:hypothetical protein